MFEGVQYLAGQNYKMCIRAEQGACFVGFQADPNHFMLQVSYVYFIMKSHSLSVTKLKLALFSKNLTFCIFSRFIQKETIEILIPTDEMVVVDHLLDVEMVIAHLIGY